MDLVAQWAEAEKGWRAEAQIINSANHAKSHRRRAWWITMHIPPHWLDLFQPIEFSAALEDGWLLDTTSNCTLTASWNGGTETQPEQNSERKMIIVNANDGSTRPPTVNEAESMMSFPRDSTACPGISNRARMKALGNAWCYRTFYMMRARHR